MNVLLKGCVVAKLLLIEDEVGVQEYFKAVVSRMGHELLTANDGPSGVALVESEPADVIMSDLNMPGEPSGMALIRRIRELRPNTPVIVVSGYPTKERLDECKALGIEDFLTKPFEMTFFSSVITRLLEEKSA
jgi:CheY-like chemotaxis protein